MEYFLPILRELSSYLEELKYIEELPVDVSADRDRCLRLLHVGLLEEELFHPIAERPYWSLL